MSLRCFAMKDSWKIPKASKEFMDFLHNSRSSICEKGGESSATPIDAQSEFQRLYPTPLHALVTLVRIKSSIFAPHFRVDCFGQTLHLDGVSRDNSLVPSIPSSLTVSEVSFSVDKKSALFVSEGLVKSDLEAPRPFLDLSLQNGAVKWDVVDNRTSSIDDELPMFRDRSLVGLVYMVSSFSSQEIIFVTLECSNETYASLCLTCHDRVKKLRHQKMFSLLI